MSRITERTLGQKESHGICANTDDVELEITSWSECQLFSGPSELDSGKVAKTLRINVYLY
jgi:hypothetical protein